MPFLDLRRFWIRKDREEYLMAGAVVIFLITSYTMAYWRKMDMLDAYSRMRPVTNELASDGQGQGQVREVGLSISRQKATTDKYYNRGDKTSSPEIPALGDGE